LCEIVPKAMGVLPSNTVFFQNFYCFLGLIESSQSFLSFISLFFYAIKSLTATHFLMVSAR